MRLTIVYSASERSMLIKLYYTIGSITKQAKNFAKKVPVKLDFLVNYTIAGLDYRWLINNPSPNAIT